MELDSERFVVSTLFRYLATCKHAHESCNVVPLVWGSLRLAPMNDQSSTGATGCRLTVSGHTNLFTQPLAVLILPLQLLLSSSTESCFRFLFGSKVLDPPRIIILHSAYDVTLETQQPEATKYSALVWLSLSISSLSLLLEKTGFCPDVAM